MRRYKHVFFAVLLSAMVLFITQWIYSDNGSQNTLHIAVVESASHNQIEVQNFIYLSDCKQAYEKLHPETSIYIEVIPAGKYSDWLFGHLLEGDLPDIFSVLPQDFYILSSMNVLEDITRQPFIQEIAPNITDAWRQNGKLYAVPYFTNPPCLIANMDLFASDKSGLQIAGFSWLDLIYYSKNYKIDQDSDGIADFFGLSNMSWRKAAYFNGAVLLDSHQKKSFFTSPNAEYAIKYAVAIDKVNLDNYNRSFEDQRCMIKVSNLGEAFYFMSTYPDRDLQVFPVPHGPDGPLYAEPYDTPLAVSSKSSRKTSAIDFLEYITLDYNNQVEMFAHSSNFPVLHRAQQEAMAQSKLRNSIDQQVLNTILQDVQPVKVDFAEYYDLMGRADSEIFQYIKNELDIDKELINLNKQLTSALEDYSSP